MELCKKCPDELVGEAKLECEECNKLFCIECAINNDFYCDCQADQKLVSIE